MSELNELDKSKYFLDEREKHLKNYAEAVLKLGLQGGLTTEETLETLMYLVFVLIEISPQPKQVADRISEGLEKFKKDLINKG